MEKNFLHKLTDLGWDYAMSDSIRSNKLMMTMFGVLKEGETWIEEDLL